MLNQKNANEQLREIFNDIENIQQLDQHPWMESLFVKDFIKNNPEIDASSPGYRLLSAISQIYFTTTPQKISTSNKRLEAKWGQYGILAALYFHPFLAKKIYPSTLSDAWETIDQSIQSVASFYKTNLDLKINATQDSPPPASTLSDWKNTGINRLAEAIFTKEQQLKQSQSEELVTDEKEDSPSKGKRKNRKKMWGALFITIFMLIISIAAMIGWEANQSYQLINQIKSNADAAISLLKTENPDLAELDILVQSSYQDARLLEEKLWTYANIGDSLSWVPYIGHDLSELDQLVTIFSDALQASHEAYLGSQDIMTLVQEGNNIFELNQTSHEILIDSAFNHFDNTHTSIERLKSTRTALSIELFSDPGQEIITNVIDPHLTLLYMLDEGLFIIEASYAIGEIAMPLSTDFDIKEWDALLAEDIIQQVNPHILTIRKHKEQVFFYREELNIDHLYPSIQPLITTYLDPHLPLTDFCLAIYDYMVALSDPFIPLLDYQEQLETAITDMDYEKIAEILNALDISDDDIQEIQSQTENFQLMYEQIDTIAIHSSLAKLLTQYVDPNLQAMPFVIDLVKLIPSLDTLGSEFTQLMNQDPLSITEITTWLEKNQNESELILESLKTTIQSRNQLDITQISPYLSTPIINHLDPALTQLYDGLLVLKNIPALLGLGEHEPQTYLILVQNEDELRATGGFITAAGTIVIDDGKPLSIQIKGSGELDNLDANYPYVPWQMDEYMHLGLWLIRDANWHPDFRIVADFAEEEYVLYSGASVDGVIALNQEALRVLLTGMQPIEYEDDIITAENVIEKLRYYRTIDNYYLPGTNKEFIEELTVAMAEQILSSGENDWNKLFEVATTALDERLILLALDQPDIQNMIYKNNWDGRFERENSDYLLMVDSNFGYNKVNPMITSEFEYFVYLTTLDEPYSILNIDHQNNVQSYVPCILLFRGYGWGYDQLLNECYWNYLRVFPAVGAELINANPQEIPAQSTLSYEVIPAQIDSLSGIDGGEGFGTFMVVPTNSEHNLTIEYKLPKEIIKLQEDNSYRYELHVQKQSGTISLDGIVKIELPANATIINASPGFKVQGNIVFWAINSRTDIHLFIDFTLTE